MGINIIKKDENTALSILKDMISQDEVVKQITVKTTVKTNKGEHTVWEIGKKDRKAIFISSKENKSK